MKTLEKVNPEGPVRIAEGVYWVGLHDEQKDLHCLPYLLVEGEKAVLIDGGSREDFPVVMMKILQAGVDPRNIVALIYQHYDPDLCGSMANLLDLCGNPNLKVISMCANNLFIQYYIDREMHMFLQDIEELDFSFSWNGRRLRFIPTPFAHCAGSFATYDESTKILFSSDLFGSLSTRWSLFLDLDEHCPACSNYELCVKGRDYCPMPDILEFHRTVMPTGRAIIHALDQFENIDFESAAPQHGSIIHGRRNIEAVMEMLRRLDGVGIDRFHP